MLGINAAGTGWFIDPTPTDNLEFQTDNSEVRGRVDVLTVIAHELGHIVGLDHTDDPNHLMADQLAVGVRRLIPEDDFEATDFAFRGWTMDVL